jgi:hypothetical protein
VANDLKALLLRLVSDLAPESDESLPGEGTLPVPLPVSPAADRPKSNRPAPPIRGGAMAGQPAVKASPSVQDGGARLVRALRQEAHAALARVQLSQSASLLTSGGSALWSLEAPIATPEGPAIAQFEISRDGGGGQDQSAEPTWRARISLNAEPNGPVHAEIAMGKGRTHVTLWTERRSALASLGARQGELLQALSDDGGAGAAVRIIEGAPPGPPPRLGQLLDRRS